MLCDPLALERYRRAENSSWGWCVLEKLNTGNVAMWHNTAKNRELIYFAIMLQT